MAKTTPPASYGASGSAITTNAPDRDAQTQATAAGEEQPAPMMRSMVRQLRPAILLTLLLALIVGVIYPLVVTAIGQTAFSSQANGSLVYVNGKPVGSKIIGQYWTQPNYFHGRPSATNNLQ
ncbi:MAG: potassium-transporting ATPase subunit C, partial [Ktedonobacterales bacterium]